MSPETIASLKAVTFPGPAGRLEGLWREAVGSKRGGAVFAHPHPLLGGTLHNKVVYRAAQALARAGWETLRFNFRGVGVSDGRYDAGRGETEDFRAALDEVDFVANSSQIVTIEGADDFFRGKLEQLAEAIGAFLARLSEPARRP